MNEFSNFRIKVITDSSSYINDPLERVNVLIESYDGQNNFYKRLYLSKDTTLDEYYSSIGTAIQDLLKEIKERQNETN